jgi:threonylcarbamoyladenosine tRNA methylthiotransferase MtaB
MRLRLRILTFGCRVNQYDSDVMRTLLAQRYEITSQAPDLLLLNACTVTALAERKARQAARRARRDHPHAVVILVGCLADAVHQGLTRFPEADLLAGNSWKPSIVDVLDRARSGAHGVLPPRLTVDLACERSAGPAARVRASLKIQDGCARVCSYCRPRMVRGEPRSKPLQAVVAEASRLVSSGFCELVLTGIDLAQYAPPDGSLAELVRRMAALPGLQRLRLASINPSGISDALLDACNASPTVCPHFHVPLQSGDDGVLRAMRRGHDITSYLRTVERIRTALPAATLGTDLIVGFPGEDEDAFANTCARVEEIGYVNVHIFRYSPRSGTEAYALPAPVPPRVVRMRSETLLRRWETTLADTLDNRIGSTQDLLVEGHREAAWRGYTRDYVEVRLISDRRFPIGSIAAAHITGRSGAVLEGVDDHRADASPDDVA